MRSRESSLRRRIDRWFVVAGGVLALLTGLSSFWLVRIGRDAVERLESLSRTESLVADFQRTVLRELEIGQRYLIDPDPELEERFVQLGREASALQEGILANVAGSPEMVTALANAQAHLAVVEASLARAHRLTDLGRTDEAREALGRTSVRLEGLIAALEEQGAVRLRAQEATLGRLESQSLRMGLSILAFFLLGFGAALMAVRWLLGRIVESVLRLASHAERLERGELAVRTDTSTLPDELKGLGTALNEASQSLQTLAEKERALHRAEKLSTVGLLVSGIAHELNNPLATILLTSEELREGSSDTSPELAETIHAQARRARGIVRQLLIAVREEDTSEEKVDVVAVLHRVRGDLEGLADQHDVELRWEVPDRLPALVGAPTGLELMVTKLVENAIEASGRGGAVRVRAHQDAGELLIDVDDTGPGIGPELRSRIFDPFFTTRADEGKAGLGLSVARGVVRSMGGVLSQTNHPAEQGGGARFRVAIPVEPGADAPSPSGPGASEPVAEVSFASDRRILVVDDEEALRRTLQRIFERNGWEVTLASNGREALERLSESDFSVILTDLKMPVMTGMELADRLISDNPAIGDRLIIMTGEHVAPGPSDFVERAPFPVVEKPFAVEEILEVATGVWVRAEGSK